MTPPLVFKRLPPASIRGPLATTAVWQSRCRGAAWAL